MRLIKRFSACALAVLLFGAAALRASAANVYTVIDGFAFDINEGAAVIHEYRGSGNSPAIPAALLDAPVTRIDSSAFFNQENLTKVSFEDAVNLRTIGSNAFFGCKGLESVAVPDCVTEISFGAFQGCSALTELKLSDSLKEIAEQTFYGCASLSEVAIPDSVQRIGAFAFGSCSELKEIWIPDSVTEIDRTAFRGDTNTLIYCLKGSYAAEYAAEKRIPYVFAGDVNGDRDINIMDVTVIQQYLAELYTLGDAALITADVNGDGIIDIGDATHLQMYLAEQDVKLGK